MKKLYVELSNKTIFELNDEIVLRLLQSKDQIVLITDEKGEWTGEAINKSFIASIRPIPEVIDSNYIKRQVESQKNASTPTQRLNSR